MLKRTMALVALALLTACDGPDRADDRNERADRLYRSAMDDYRAGRMAAAAKGFENVLQKDPSNSNARFQLACLLQDSLRDYVGAFCDYREYLRQRPDADKAALARDRLALCEKEMALAMADKHGITGAEGFAKELQAVRGELKESEDKVRMAEKELATARAKIEALTAERDRLVAMVKGDAAEDVAAAKVPSAKEAKDLLDEDDEIADRITMSADAALLKKDDLDENTEASPLLPKQDSATAAKPKDGIFSKKKDEKPKGVDRPKTYVVQEGDTLYGVAKRFYGKMSAWKKIRDANKTRISSDNRLKLGDEIVLP